MCSDASDPRRARRSLRSHPPSNSQHSTTTSAQTQPTHKAAPTTLHGLTHRPPHIALSTPRRMPLPPPRTPRTCGSPSLPVPAAFAHVQRPEGRSWQPDLASRHATPSSQQLLEVGAQAARHLPPRDEGAHAGHAAPRERAPSGRDLVEARLYMPYTCHTHEAAHVHTRMGCMFGADVRSRRGAPPPRQGRPTRPTAWCGTWAGRAIGGRSRTRARNAAEGCRRGMPQRRPGIGARAVRWARAAHSSTSDSSALNQHTLRTQSVKGCDGLGRRTPRRACAASGTACATPCSR